MKLIYKNILFKYLIFTFLLISINSCAGRISNHGVLNIEKHIDSILDNKLEKAEIEALLGNPSTVSAFEFNKWYYINSSIKHFAFYKPEIINLKVYEIIFNSENQAYEINTYDQDDLKELNFNSDVTETRGNKKSFLQLILKGIGESNLKK
ncbi:MAG: outer membrane protein assembly factor BamE [Alphaproteobacteria bacterium]|tara:strand:+ start:191 stop:643 length:453 start_codon:yes stop_codon:yes gene_type:complete